MVKPTTEQLNAWDNAIAKVNENVEYLAYLYSRWQDEKEFEDFDQYKKAIIEKFQGIAVHSIKKSPFSFSLKPLPELPSIIVKVNSREVSWKMSN